MALCGLALPCAWNVLSWRRAEQTLRLDLTRQVALATRQFQSVLRGLLDEGPEAEARVTEAMHLFATTGQASAIRLRRGGHTTIELGDWSRVGGEGVATWMLPEDEMAATEVSLDRVTRVQAPFRLGRDQYTLEMLINGPGLRDAQRYAILEQLALQWLLVVVSMLVVVLLVRRWLTTPLKEVLELLQVGARPEAFQALAAEHTGEFRQAAVALSEVLRELETTRRESGERRRAVEGLYDLAPVAMLTTDAAAQITGANRAAAELLGGGADELRGRTMHELLSPQDRVLFDEVLNRLRTEDQTRCQLRLRDRFGGPMVDASVQASAVRDAAGELAGARLALVDTTALKRVQAHLLERATRLKLALDHMSEAVLLVDEAGRVVVFNEAAATLLRTHPSAIEKHAVASERFWDGLGIDDAVGLCGRLTALIEGGSRAMHERIETRAGVFALQGVTVRDGAGVSVGTLLTLQEVTREEQNAEQLAQHKRQLQVMRRVAPALTDVRSIDGLLERTAEQMLSVLEVDAVGVAVRDGSSGRRAKQVVHRGTQPYLLEGHQALARSVEVELLPRVLAQPDLMFWPDLELAATPWASSFHATGLTSLAAAAVRGSADVQGVLWIARRGGETLEQHQLGLLETLCPLVAARLEMAQLVERLQGLHLVDPVTDLPSHLQFERAMYKMVGRPGQPCTLLVIDLDRFGEVNERLGRLASDGLMHAVATRLLGACRKSGFVARFAGSSFGMLIPDVEGEQAAALGERMRQVVGREPFSVEGEPVAVTASVGVASFPGDALRADDLLDLALVRVAMAKRQGRDRVVAEGVDLSKQAG